MRPSLPVCRCLTLHLLSSWGSGFVHLRVETIQLLQGSLRLVGPCCRASGWGCADDECLRRGWLAEVVDAGVIGIAVVVFKVGEGGGVRGEVAGADLCVPRLIAVRQRKRGTSTQRKAFDKLSIRLRFSEKFFLSLFGSVFFFCCMEKHQKAIFTGVIPATDVGNPVQLLFTQSLQFVFCRFALVLFFLSKPG